MGQLEASHIKDQAANFPKRTRWPATWKPRRQLTQYDRKTRRSCSLGAKGPSQQCELGSRRLGDLTLWQRGSLARWTPKKQQSLRPRPIGGRDNRRAGGRRPRRAERGRAGGATPSPPRTPTAKEPRRTRRPERLAAWKIGNRVLDHQVTKSPSFPGVKFLTDLEDLEPRRLESWEGWAGSQLDEEAAKKPGGHCKAIAKAPWDPGKGAPLINRRLGTLINAKPSHVGSLALGKT